MAPASGGSVAVKGKGSSRQVGDREIEEHVAGAGIEGRYRKSRSDWRESGEVGDSSDVEEGAGALPGEEGAVKDRGEGCPMAPLRHIGPPELADHRGAKELSQGKGLGGLIGDPPGERGGGEKTQRVGFGVVADGDPVCSDGIEVVGSQPRISKKSVGQRFFH